MADIARPPTRRPPLGEATRRVNNSQHSRLLDSSPKDSGLPHHESIRVGGLLQVRNAPASPLSQADHEALADFTRDGSPSNPRLSAISKEYPDSKRNSQISTVSTNASDGKKIKSLIGPWRLGKTLGRGATARVRLARHLHTGQEAAVKIVQKKNAQISQAGSLAALDKAMAALPDAGDGLRPMPVGIEREVAIMKLIEHPNIMKLYDIWENRHEIYLVLEYVDHGELFEHIASKGRLDEEEAIKFFRQILSAVGYCHSINICHRDLKPENILLNSSGDIKIADFGMAALHQSPGYKLKTSCGSPHYAAPELVKGDKYRGDKADMWSMGVILFAMLAGRLPFDVDAPPDRDWIPTLLAKIKRGQYEMERHFSPEAQHLISRILQVNPRERITMEQLWKHPLIRKYDYLDDFGQRSPQSPIIKDCGRPVARRTEIDKELMRHLRSMWHTLTEEQLIHLLLCDIPNDQKMFYNLFLRYRDAQLENYIPDGVGYSKSDYHHVRPPGMTKTYSTMHFPQMTSNGHARQASRFTVISNTADTEYSYDPFKASRSQHIHEAYSDRAKVTILLNPDRQSRTNLPRQASRASSIRRRSLVPPRTIVSRSSLASSTRSRNSTFRASAPYKRGVSFTHIRSFGSERNVSASTLFSATANRHSSNTEVTDDGGDFLRPIAIPASTRYIRSRKAHILASRPVLAPPKPVRSSLLWGDDVRQLSTSLADDCDKAFNRTSTVTKADTFRTSILSDERASTGDWGATATSTSHRRQEARRPKNQGLIDTRPLPALPTRTTSTRLELFTAKKQAEARKASATESPTYLDRMVSHIDKLIQPSSPSHSTAERRTLSAPVEKRVDSLARPVPSIVEAKDATSRTRHYDQQIETTSNRIASAPEPRATSRINKSNSKSLNPRSKETIRVVNPSSPMSPVKVPQPVTVRKMGSSSGRQPSKPLPVMSGALMDDLSTLNYSRQSTAGLRNQYLADAAVNSPELERIDEDYVDERCTERNNGTIVKKKATWFKRNSRGSDGSRMSVEGSCATRSQSSSNEARQPRELPLPPIPKTKKLSTRIGRLFKRRSSRSEEDAVFAHDVFEDNTSTLDYVALSNRPQELRDRKIEPQQSWLAKLFHVKPASKFICFQVTKRRARQEVTNILKEWRRYGIRDVQVDKERNIVFGKVAAKNYLDMKEVAFVGEIMTVIEHGKRSYLSIARFTQEQGAASSFNKVVETLETVLRCRGMLVVDEGKRRMMIKTLNAASY